jgi:orotidine-5'-phosphate decarboxylase
MNRAALIDQIRKKKTFLCVGLDPDPDKIPAHLKKNEFPVYDFCKQIVDATAPYCVAFKPNMAFFEAEGLLGWQQLEMLIGYLKVQYPDHFTIADAKRGDIGNTSERYAKAFLEKMGFDSITVAPYMGSDSVKPFFLPDKWVILLLLTSNQGAADFQFSDNVLNRSLYKIIAEKAREWGTEENLMFVTGATQADYLKEIRTLLPHHFFLVPGVGVQGGDLKAVCAAAMNEDIGLLVNASRSILYASAGEDFAEMAKEEAKKIANEMAAYT